MDSHLFLEFYITPWPEELSCMALTAFVPETAVEDSSFIWKSTSACTPCWKEHAPNLIKHRYTIIFCRKRQVLPRGDIGLLKRTHIAQWLTSVRPYLKWSPKQFPPYMHPIHSIHSLMYHKTDIKLSHRNLNIFTAEGNAVFIDSIYALWGHFGIIFLIIDLLQGGFGKSLQLALGAVFSAFSSMIMPGSVIASGRSWISYRPSPDSRLEVVQGSPFTREVSVSSSASLMTSPIISLLPVESQKVLGSHLLLK